MYMLSGISNYNILVIPKVNVLYLDSIIECVHVQSISTNFSLTCSKLRSELRKFVAHSEIKNQFVKLAFDWLLLNV